MDLAQLTNQPIHVEIGGKSYAFAEIPADGLGRLQAWLKEHYPHPLRALVGQLDGFSDEEKAELFRQARQDALEWPPEVSTAAGTAALMRAEEGQIRTLHESLKVHQPETALSDARRVYKALMAETAHRILLRGFDPERTMRRIVRVAFGMGDLEAEDEGEDPKVLPIRAVPVPTGSNGT